MLAQLPKPGVSFLSDSTRFQNPTHMKNNIKPSFYYSAYPLKAIEQAVVSAKNGEPSPRLKALLSKDQPAKSRIRIHPMVNPYKSMLKALTPRFRKPKEVEPTGKDWYINYE